MARDGLWLGLVIGLAVGVPVGVALVLVLTRPAAVGVGGMGQPPGTYNNTERWELVDDEKGNLKEVIVHREARRT